MNRTLCRIDDIADPGAKGFTFGHGTERQDIFVVRRGDRLFGYLNACPHQGTPLEFLPDRFLTRDGSEILCSTHGARFDIATGLCIAGPCKGMRLATIWLEVADRQIIWRT